MHKALTLLLENRPSENYSKKELKAIQDYVAEYQDKANTLDREYGLTKVGALNFSKNGITPKVELVPFNPDALSEATEGPVSDEKAEDAHRTTDGDTKA